MSANESFAIDRADLMAPLVPTFCYELDGVLHVPHYRYGREFVSPGYGRTHLVRRTRMDLESRGAKKVTHMLWPRGRAR